MRPSTKLVSFAIALACASGAHAQQVVRIGHVGPVSGPNSHLGKDNENAARMAVDELNGKGFAINGQRVTLQLLAEDDASDPKQGTAVAQKLVDAKVNGVVGHLNSGTSVPASRIYHNAGLVQISPATTPCSRSRNSRACSGWWPTTPSWAAHWASTRSRRSR